MTSIYVSDLTLDLLWIPNGGSGFLQFVTKIYLLQQSLTSPSSSVLSNFFSSQRASVISLFQKYIGICGAYAMFLYIIWLLFFSIYVFLFKIVYFIFIDNLDSHRHFLYISKYIFSVLNLDCIYFVCVATDRIWCLQTSHHIRWSTNVIEKLKISNK